MMQVRWEDDRSETLPWQGYFRLVFPRSIELAFDCSGRGQMKSAKLYTRKANVWEGCDYKGRFVQIEKLQEMRYKWQNMAWLFVDATDEYIVH